MFQKRGIGLRSPSLELLQLPKIFLPRECEKFMGYRVRHSYTMIGIILLYVLFSNLINSWGVTLLVLITFSGILTIYWSDKIMIFAVGSTYRNSHPLREGLEFIGPHPGHPDGWRGRG